MKTLGLALGLLGGCLQPLRAWQEVGSYDTPTEKVSSVQVNDNKVYLSTGSQIYIVDTSNPSAIRLICTFTVSGDVGTHGIVDIDYSNSHIYAWTSNERLIIIDVSNPSSPVQRSNTAHGEALLRYAQQVRVSGNRAYGTTKIGAGQGVAIIDVSSPSAQRKLASIETMANVAVPVGNRLYVGHGNGDGLLVYDITNVSSPQLLGSSKFSFSSLTVNGIESVRGYIVLATSQGVISVDASDPLNMRRMDYKSGERMSMVALDRDAVAATHWGNGIVMYQVTSTGLLTLLHSQSCGTEKLAYGNGFLYGFVDPIGTSSLRIYDTGLVQTLTVSPSSRAHTSAAASGQTIGVTANVSWTATAGAAWLTVTGGSSGSGNGTVTYSVAANSFAAARSGTITVAGGGMTRTFTVDQAAAAASLAISPASRSHTCAAASGQTIGVTANTSWTATSGAAWLTVTGGSSGSGNGTVTYSVATNGVTVARSGTITVVGGGMTRAFTVNQAATAASLAISPSTRNHTCEAAVGQTIGVTANVSWTATAGAAWLTVTGGSSGSGNGTVTYSVAANSFAAARSGTITVAGGGMTRTFTVNQAFVVLPGSGTDADPYLISSKLELLVKAADPALCQKHFKLTADIDLAGEAFTAAVIAPAVNPTKWNYGGTPFSGTFDGDGHVIRNVAINAPSGLWIGFFGQLSGTVKNLGLENCAIVGSGIVAGLCADNFNGLIENCYAAGTVNGKEHTGGVCGDNYGGTIKNCFSFCSVASGVWRGGGLCGRNYAGRIENCYSAGSVSGGREIGGLTGNDNCEGTVSVTLNSFWDTQASGRSTSAGGTGLNTAQMTDQSTFAVAGWSLSESGIWRMSAPAEGSGGYPVLRLFVNNTVTLGAPSGGGAGVSSPGSYDGYFYGEGDFNGSQALAAQGTLNVKVAKASGALTAKAVLQKGSLSFSAKAWTATEADGTRRATLPGKGGETLDLYVRQDRVWGTLSGGSVGGTLELDGTRNRFAEKGDAAAQALLNRYLGYYTVALPAYDALSLGSAEAAPRGVGYLAVTVGKGGSAKIAGVLADGTKVTQSSRLVLFGEDAACVPFFAPLYMKRGWVGGLLWVAPDRGAVATDRDLGWFVRWEKPGAGPEGFRELLDTCGGYYSSLQPLAAHYLLTAGTNAVPYRYAGGSADLQTAALPDGIGVAYQGGRLVITRGTRPAPADGAYDYSAENSAMATLSFAARTGIFKGKFSLYYDYTLNGRLIHKAVSAPYAGVLTPVRSADFAAQPAGQGYYLVPDNDPALKAYRLKRSFPVRLDTAP